MRALETRRGAAAWIEREAGGVGGVEWAEPGRRREEER